MIGSDKGDGEIGWSGGRHKVVDHVGVIRWFVDWVGLGSINIGVSRRRQGLGSHILIEDGVPLNVIPLVQSSSLKSSCLKKRKKEKEKHIY